MSALMTPIVFDNGGGEATIGDLVRVRGLRHDHPLLDWPGFLARGLDLQVEVRNPEREVVGGFTFRFSEAWRKQVNALRSSASAASVVWHCLVNRATPLSPRPRPKQDFDTRARSNRLRQAFPHALLAREVGKQYGRGFVESIASQVQPERRGMFGILTNDVPENEVFQDLASLWSPTDTGHRTISDTVARGDDPTTTFASRFIKPGLVKAKDASALAVIEGETVVQSVFGLSRVGFENLYKMDGSWRDFRRASNSGSLAEMTLHRMLALAPDPPETASRGGYHTAGVAPNQSPISPGEFHNQIAALNAHAWLMRLLGLAVDIEIDLDLVGVTSAMTRIDIRVVQCILGDKQGQTLDPVQSQVACSVVDLFPAGRPGSRDQFSNGCLDLSVPLQDGGARFHLDQLDADSAIEKLIQAANSMQTQFESGLTSVERKVALQSLRTTGMSLYDRGVSIDELDRLGKPAEEPLFAQDLVIGYRPDVSTLEVNEDGSVCVQSWKSLVTRRLEGLDLRGRNAVDQLGVPVFDEGYVTSRMSRVTRSNGQVVEQIPQEELLTWKNWSLAVPPAECSTTNGLDGFFGLFGRNILLNVRYKAYGGLPEQRFRWGYRLGMRAVYVDGRSVSLAEAATLYDQDAIGARGACKPDDETIRPGAKGPALAIGDGNRYQRFMRYEPILPPDVLLEGPLPKSTLRGERSGRVLVASGPTGKIVQARSARVFVPPRVDLELAIRHGMFDSPQAREKPPASAFPGVCLNYADGGFPSISNPAMAGVLGLAEAETAGTQELVFRRSLFANPPRVPYLPDPWAKRLVIAIYRKADNQILEFHHFDFYDARHPWPNCREMHLEVRADVAGEVSHLGFNATWEDNRLVIIVAAGQELALRAWFEIDEKMMASSGAIDAMARFISTTDAEGCCKVLGIPPCCADDVRSAHDELVRCLSGWYERFPANLSSYFAKGTRSRRVITPSFWMLNPYVAIEIAHASSHAHSELAFSEAGPPTSGRTVASPSSRSAIEQRFDCVTSPEREEAVFVGDVRFHRASTSRIECHASWKEVDDSLRAGSKVTWTSRQDKVFVLSQLPGALSNPGMGDGPELAEDNDLALLNGPRLSMRRSRNEDLERQVAGSAGKMHELAYSFPDHRARHVTFQLKAFSRFASDFVEGAAGIAKSSLPASRWINARRPPDAPKVAYVVPLFEWEHHAGGRSARHHRKGGQFRIWLERPWFSSGEGELLALICWPENLFVAQTTGEVRDSSRNLVSHLYARTAELREWAGFHPASKDQPGFGHPLFKLSTAWGGDPLWNEDANLNAIPPHAFLNRLKDRDVRSRLSQFRGTPYEGMLVSLALYEPAFDEAEGRWFVDVHLDPGTAYFPFVRLGLSRYQPNACDGMHVSEIVATEFIQLLPSRVATVTSRRAGKKVEVELAVHGTRPTGLSAFGQRSNEFHPRLFARIDEQSLGFDRDGEVWEPDDNPQGYLELIGNGVWVPCNHGEQKSSERRKEMRELTDKDAQLPAWKIELEFVPRANCRYSIYLEEQEPFIRDQDPMRTEESEFTACPTGVIDWRVVYSDRLLVRT